MARSRVTTTPTTIRTQEELDAALREVGELKRQLGAITATMNAEIDQIKVAAEQQAFPLNHRQAILENAMAAWGELQKKELFADRRSIELTFGTVGFRRSTEIKPALRNTWDTVMEKLKEQKLPHLIRLKPEVDREAIREWSPERLATIGARRVEKDTFWYEVATAALAEPLG